MYVERASKVEECYKLCSAYGRGSLYTLRLVQKTEMMVADFVC